MGSRLCTLLLPGRGQKANTFELVILITYHQYKYSLKALNNLNLRIQNGVILADFYTNRRIEMSNENTWLTRAEYLDKCRDRRTNRAYEFRRLMKDNIWTQSDLSRHLGVSRAWISKVLNVKNRFKGVK